MTTLPASDLPTASARPPRAPPPRALRRLAWACVLLMLTVTTASAWLRLAQPRPVCVDWPGCRSAERPPGPVRAGGTPALAASVRGVHRVAASAALLVSLAVVVLALRRRPRAPATLAHGAALLALALALAALGIVTPGSRAAPVLLGNQLGGLLMLALAWRLLRRLPQAGAARPRLAADPRPRPAGLGAVAASVWLVQAGVGAWSGAGGSGAAPAVHLALALVALPLGVATGWAACRRGRTAEGRALLGLVALQAVLGAAAAAGSAGAALVLAHNVGAAVGLALLTGTTAATPVRHSPA